MRKIKHISVKCSLLNVHRKIKVSFWLIHFTQFDCQLKNKRTNHTGWKDSVNIQNVVLIITKENQFEHEPQLAPGPDNGHVWSNDLMMETYWLFCLRMLIWGKGFRPHRDFLFCSLAEFIKLLSDHVYWIKTLYRLKQIYLTRFEVVEVVR